MASLTFIKDEGVILIFFLMAQLAFYADMFASQGIMGQVMIEDGLTGQRFPRFSCMTLFTVRTQYASVFILMARGTRGMRYFSELLFSVHQLMTLATLKSGVFPR